MDIDEFPALPRRERSAVRLRYWSAQARAYAPPRGRGLVRFTARQQHSSCIRLLRLRGGERVLDAGCGSGLLTRALVARGARVWAVDSCPAMLAQVERAERALCCDIEALDLGEQFDAVVCAGALNFVNADKALPRLAAHTRTGGALVLVITRPSILGLMYAASRAYAKVPFHLYSAKSIVERARALGFELTRRENLLPHDASLGLRKAAR